MGGYRRGAYEKGHPVIRKFPFAFDTPDLLTGHTVYTPTVGDILLDAWIEIDVGWDGTTPMADIGQFGADSGWFYNGTPGALPLDAPDATLAGDYRHGANVWPNGSYALSVGGALNTPGQQFRWAPGKFITANPVLIVVSQDGLRNGDDPGSTQGSAVLYLVTATPV